MNNDYTYEIISKFSYVIYDRNGNRLEATEYFDSVHNAIFCATGHINLLKKGENKDV